MDALQQHHRFSRPPPPPPPLPPMADSQQPPRPPPPQGPWYSGQFQYQAASQPPPPAWPPHSDHQPLPPSSSSSIPQQSHLPPYPPHPQQHGNYLPPHTPHHMPPPPPLPYSHPPQAYPQPGAHQAWGNPNWVHHQGWEHPDRNISNNNEEEWAARARAWAAAKAAMENQHLQPQFSRLGGQEDHVYHDQYQQAVEPHYTDIQQPSLPQSNHQQLPASFVNSHGQPVNHLQETSSFSAGPPSSYVSEGHMSYTCRDGAQAGDSTSVFHRQGSFPTNSAVYQQEVPSSYSSASGKEEAGDPNDVLHSASTLPESSPYMQPTAASGRSIPGEQPHFTYGNRLAESTIDPSDRPLEFAPGFNRNHDSHDQHPHTGYRHPDAAGSMDPIAPVPPIHALTPPVPGAVYPPIPAVPSGLQFDPSFVAPSVPGQAVPMFGQIPGSNFRPTIPPVSASFGLGAGTTLHLQAAFPGDANGVSNVSEHPKKAPVPNWLREEIIKKAVNKSSSQGHSVEDHDDSNEGGIEKSFTRAGQTDDKSNGSSRSSDDEDDDEDEIEAARTAAINQEIKRVLTEVLLKVTDELFDEIATKVLSEDNLMVEVDHITPSNDKALPSPPAVPTPKASAKVLVPFKTKDPEVDVASGQSSSGSPGDVLGLASYASDDDDEETQSSRNPTMGQMDSSNLQSSGNNLLPFTTDVIENGNSQADSEGISGGQTNVDKVIHKTSVVGKGLSDGKVDKDFNHGENILPAALTEGSGIREDKIIIDGGKTGEAKDSFRSKDIVGGQTYIQSELLHEDDSKKSTLNVSQGREVRSKSDMGDEHGSKRSSSVKEPAKQVESGKVKADEKHSGSIEPRRDEKYVRRERMDDRNSSKERVKDRGTKEIESKKNSNNKGDKRDAEKVKRSSSKDDSSRKRERAKDEKEDSVRHRTLRDPSRHKRRRSSSTGGRGRDGKDDSFGSRANESSDEDSENSRQRKLNSRKNSLSPSPTRSRRRHVSRSPHSKHSQRRHSPYSSLESMRGRRSRSKSPIRRRR